MSCLSSLGVLSARWDSGSSESGKLRASLTDYIQWNDTIHFDDVRHSSFDSVILVGLIRRQLFWKIATEIQIRDGL